jgi:hypothetical protein
MNNINLAFRLAERVVDDMDKATLYKYVLNLCDEEYNGLPEFAEQVVQDMSHQALYEHVLFDYYHQYLKHEEQELIKLGKEMYPN